MKNKKMVATLASLCLIVVAVVAAVVGVLAAVTQAVSSTMSVRFTAKNVNARVELKSMGPNSGVRESTWTLYDDNDTDTEEVTSVRFYPYTSKAAQAVVLQGEDYQFGWKTDESEFYSVAIYRFEISNYHTGHRLKVTPTWNSAPTGVQIIYCKGAGSLGFGDVDDTTSRNSQTGLLANNGLVLTASAQESFASLTSGTSFYIGEATDGQTVTPTTQYVYMIVALTSLDNDISGENAQEQPNLAGILSIALEDDASVTPVQP